MPLLRSRRMRSKSDKAKARDKVLANTKRELLRRSGGCCEGCGSRDYRLDGAHLVGRGNKGIGVPWCDLPELMAVLCHSDPRDGHVGCHERIDRGLDATLLEKLRWTGFGRLIHRVGRYDLATKATHANAGFPLATIRSLVGELERLGVGPNE